MKCTVPHQRSIAVRALIAVALSVATLTAVAAAPRQRDVALAFEARAVIASGIEPGGSAVFFSVSREPVAYGTRSVRRERIVRDADGDGVVRYDLREDVQRQSIWIVVDLGSGASGMDAPAGFPLRKKPLHARALKQDLRGNAERLEYGRAYLEVLVVRPSTGAWGLSSGDGGSLDQDGADDGKVTMTAAQLQPIGRTPAAPGQFAPGDLIVLIDPFAMEVFATEVSK